MKRFGTGLIVRNDLSAPGDRRGASAAYCRQLPAKFQITVDCSDPDRLARFWAPALAYILQPPPDGHDTWRNYWQSVGVPDNEIDDGYDSIIDPSGDGVRIWFQRVPKK